MATQKRFIVKNGLDNNGLTITNVATPVNPSDAVDKASLDLKANLASPTFTGTVSGITKAMVGLPNVENTALSIGLVLLVLLLQVQLLQALGVVLLVLSQVQT